MGLLQRKMVVTSDFSVNHISQVGFRLKILNPRISQSSFTKILQLCNGPQSKVGTAKEGH